jgi:hypothetical protein
VVLSERLHIQQQAPRVDVVQLTGLPQHVLQAEQQHPHVTASATLTTTYVGGMGAGVCTGVAAEAAAAMRKLFSFGAETHGKGKVLFKWSPGGAFLATCGVTVRAIPPYPPYPVRS